jgi:hypothetical protein
MKRLHALLCIFAVTGLSSCGGNPTLTEDEPDASVNPDGPGPVIIDGMEVDPDCVPRECSEASCGTVPDGCGRTVDCGQCSDGERCGIVSANECTSLASLAQPLSEAEACAGRECGPAGDGIGGVVECGDCEGGQVCGANGPAQCGTPGAFDEDECPSRILDCASVGASCGLIGNGCGGVLDCDAEAGCAEGSVCGLEEPFQCASAPDCEPLDPVDACAGKCGFVSNGCGKEVDGGLIDCSVAGVACESGEVCGGGGVPNECAVGSCEPLPEADACLDRSCGQTTDGCDGSVDCGSCDASEVCVDGTCEPLCNPIAEAEACAEKDCGQVGDGCGGTYDCGGCDVGEACGQFDPFMCDPLPPDACIPFSEAEACAGRECGIVLDGCGSAPENEIDCSVSGGGCGADEVCGVVTPFQCDLPEPPDCTPAASCAELGWECGVAIDACGNLFDCALEDRVCNAQTESCIGGVDGPAQCLNGTEGQGSCDVCDAIPDCSGMPQRTRLTGRVITPGADDADTLNQVGIPNAFVYILRNDDESELPAIISGIPNDGSGFTTACDRCDEQDLGPVLVSTSTNGFGEFLLEGEIPVDRDFVLVVKIGKWRRATRIPALPTTAACETTALSPLDTRLPRSMGDGLGANLPRVAVSTGRIDAMECVLHKLGVSVSEFAQPGPAGDAPARIHMYRSPTNGGARMSTGFTAANALYSDINRLFSYDLVVFDCEGAAFDRNSDDGRIREYVNRGGRMFASHWSYTWLYDNGTAAYSAATPFTTGLAQSAVWGIGDEPTDTVWASVGRPGARPAKIANFAAWLEREGAATVDALGRYALDIIEPRDLALTVGASSEEYVYRLPDATTGTHCKPCTSITSAHNCSSSPSCSWDAQSSTCRVANDCTTKDQAACTADSDCTWTTTCNFAETCTVGGTEQSECLTRARCGWDYTSVQQYAFNTPYGAPDEAVCGRVAYSGFHVVADPAGYDAVVFPNHCTGDLTSQEKVLTYMLFDLGACISPGGLTPPPCTPLDASACAGRCGPIADGCGGVIECAECPLGQVCLPGGVCGAPECEVTTCEAEGAECGSVGDGCGGVLDCGPCPEGESCGLVTKNQCDAPCPTSDPALACEDKCGFVSDDCSGVHDCGECPPGLTCVDNECVDRTCEPRTSCPAGFECGTTSDGCDGTLDCGDCEPPEVCGGSGLGHVCGIPECPALDCEAAQAECGAIGDGCGQSLDCGDCPAGQLCGLGGPNQCGGCSPRTCEDAGAECGAIGTGCGDSIDCGPCPEGEICGAAGPNRCGSGECPPQSCDDQGAECGIIGDGCGDTVDCGDCPGDEICGIAEPFQCGDPPACEPRTCEQAGAQCGLISDECGDVVDCGDCPAGSFCRADNTCSRGSR